jgi:hypothetical protein
VAWKRSIPPTDTDPMVSPWYASRREMNFVFRADAPPCCCQYWNAIFSAISAAVEPESE